MTLEAGADGKPAGRVFEAADERNDPLIRRIAAFGQQAGLAFVIIVAAVVFQSLNPIFLSEGNLIEIFRSGEE